MVSDLPEEEVPDHFGTPFRVTEQLVTSVVLQETLVTFVGGIVRTREGVEEKVSMFGCNTITVTNDEEDPPTPEHVT